MAGYFKLVDAHDDGFRVKLTAPDGTLVAVSTFYASKEEAIAGIELIREIAGTGPVVDHSRADTPDREEFFVGPRDTARPDTARRNTARRDGAMRHDA